MSIHIEMSPEMWDKLRALQRIVDSESRTLIDNEIMRLYFGDDAPQFEAVTRKDVEWWVYGHSEIDNSSALEHINSRCNSVGVTTEINDKLQARRNVSDSDVDGVSNG